MIEFATEDLEIVNDIIALLYDPGSFLCSLTRRAGFQKVFFIR